MAQFETGANDPRRRLLADVTLLDEIIHTACRRLSARHPVGGPPSLSELERVARSLQAIQQVLAELRRAQDPADAVAGVHAAVHTAMTDLLAADDQPR